MSDNKATIYIESDAGQAVGEFERARQSFDAMAAELQDGIGKIDGFEALSRETYDLETAFHAADSKVRALGDAINASEEPSRRLQREYRAAHREALGLKEALDKKRATLAASGQALQDAGLNTANLRGQQAGLKKSLEEARVAFADLARVANARDALSVKPFADIRAEIGRLQAAYTTLAQSGKLSSDELAQAKARLIEKTRALEAQTNGWVQSLDAVKLRAASAIGALAANLTALAGGWKKNADLAERMAEVFTLIDGPKAKIDSLRAGVEQLSRRMGIDAVAAARGLYDIISSGIPEDNALAVLEQAAIAAKAGVTDTATAVKAGLGVINAYGKDISELGDVYDTLFQTVKDGVTTFPELAQSIGPVLPVARAAGVGFDEVAAAIATMTKAGIATPQAATALRGALTALSSPSDEAKKALRAIGIEWNGLVGTLEQIKGKALGADAMRAILPDVEGRTAVLALTQSFEQLQGTLAGMEQAAGATEAAYAKIEDTPRESLNKLNQEFEALQRTMGETTDATLQPMITALHGLLSSFNELPAPVKATAVELVAVGAAVGTLAVLGRTILPALLALRASIVGLGAESAAAAGGVGLLAKAFKGFAVLEILLHFKEIGKWIGETAGKLIHGKIAAVDFGEAAVQSGKAAADGFDNTRGAAAAAALAIDDIDKNQRLAQLTQGARDLVVGFDTLRTKGETTGKAIEEVFSKANLASPVGIRDLVAAMEALRASGRAAEHELRDGLEKRLSSLSGTALASFAISARAAFGEGEQGAQSLSLLLETVLKRAIVSSGQDFDVLTSGVSRGLQDALAHVDLLVDNLDTLKTMGVDAGAAIEGALVAAFRKVSTQTEFDAVMQTMGRLGIEAEKAGQRIGEAMRDAKKHADEATPGINSVAEAYRALGMKSQEELKASAQTAKEAYDTIKASGTASAQELRAAFTAYAKAAIEANGGVASELLKAEAAARGMTIEIDAAGRATVKLAESAGEAAEETRELQQQEKEAAEAAKQQAEASRAAALDTAALARQMGVGAEQSERYTRKLNELIAAQMQAGNASLEVIGAAQRAAADYEAAMTHIDDLTARITAAAQSGSAELAQLVAEGEAAAKVGTTVGEEDLSGLRSALSAAKSQMESLKDSAEDTLSSLQQELAQLNGNYAEAERLRHEARRADLEAQLAIAQAQGNAAAASALSRSLSVLDQIAAKKIAEAQRRETEEAPGAAAGAGSTAGFGVSSSAGGGSARRAVAGGPAAAPQRTDPAPAVRTVTINLRTDSGRSSEVSVPEGSEKRFIRVLQDAGLAAGRG